MQPTDDFQAYLKAAAPRLENAPGSCPEVAQLLEHYRGTLDPAARNRVESHLAQCAPCRDTLRELRDFMEPARPGEAAPNLDAEWDRLANRIEGNPSRAAATVSGRPWRFAAAMAACLALSVALSVLYAQQRAYVARMAALEQENGRLRQQNEAGAKELAGLKAPHLNTAVYDVFSSAVLTRSAGPSAVTPIDAAEGAPLVLMLSGQEVAPSPDYQIEILDSDGRAVWQSPGLQRTKLGSFVITLPPGFLANGTYRIWLSGKTSRGYERISDYAIAVKTRR